MKTTGGVPDFSAPQALQLEPRHFVLAFLQKSLIALITPT